MDVTEPITPPPEPCAPSFVPAGAMFSLRVLTNLFPGTSGSLRSLAQVGSGAGASPSMSLRAVLVAATDLIAQPRVIEPPARFVALPYKVVLDGPLGFADDPSDRRWQPAKPPSGDMSWMTHGPYDSERRLIPALLNAGRQFEPHHGNMLEAALAVLRGDDPFGIALADLSVTSRDGYDEFARWEMGDAEFVGRVKASASARFAPGDLPSDAAVEAACRTVRDRAYTVAYALRGPYPQRLAVRWPLGWIAASGEVSPLHRPVDVTSAPYPQFEIPVTVGGLVPGGNVMGPTVTVTARFYIAAPPLDVMKTADPPPEGRPPHPLTGWSFQPPTVPPDHRVILFVHGHSSNAEEALDLVPALHRAGLARGVRFSVISVDLPCNGYSSMHWHDSIAMSESTTYPSGVFDHGQIRTPILDFIENFLVAFVDALDAITPIKDRFAGVIGGSLGGNLGLRLGRRDPALFPWLARGIVSWDPASVWPAMVQDVGKSIASDQCRSRWEETEGDLSRSMYFEQTFDAATDIGPFQLLPPQAQMWYRDGWEPCKTQHILASRQERREMYNARFRTWHWRVACEQLVYSHVDHVDHEDHSTPLRCTLNTIRQLLLAGKEDDYTGAKIYTNTRELAPWLHTPGRTVFLLDTGHSIHAERPNFLAEQIASFFTGETSP